MLITSDRYSIDIPATRGTTATATARVYSLNPAGGGAQRVRVVRVLARALVHLRQPPPFVERISQPHWLFAVEDEVDDVVDRPHHVPDVPRDRVRDAAAGVVELLVGQALGRHLGVLQHARDEHRVLRGHRRRVAHPGQVCHQYAPCRSKMRRGFSIII
jgi:hypothetical protein